jgi:hypothetical protein
VGVETVSALHWLHQVADLQRVGTRLRRKKDEQISIQAMIAETL